MKRFLSWVVLLVGMLALDIVFGLMTRLAMWVVGLLAGLKVWLIVVIVLVAGSAFVGLVSLPASYGTGLLVRLCEKICPTRKGIRYYVGAGLWALYVLAAVVAVARVHDYWWLLIQAAMIAYAAVAMGVVGAETAGENEAAARKAERDKALPPIGDLMLERRRQVAADLAENGDFSGYRELGYSEEEIRAAKAKWREDHFSGPEFDDARRWADWLAARGDFSGFLQLGYDQADVNAMQRLWRERTKEEYPPRLDGQEGDHGETD